MTWACTPCGSSTTFWLHFRGKAIDKQYQASLISKEKKVKLICNKATQIEVLTMFQLST
jgi:hypothetical protein